MKFSARVWRHVPRGAEPLHLGKIFKRSEGRWNVNGEFACLYTALTDAGARGEMAKLAAQSGSIVRPRDLVSIDVELEPVLDLRDEREVRRLSLTAGLPYQPAKLTEDGVAAYRYCHQLATVARGEGYTGLIVPSAAVDGEANLVIYFDVVAPKQVAIDNGPDRVPLDP